MKHGFPLQDFTCYYNFLKCIEAKKKKKHCQFCFLYHKRHENLTIYQTLV